jgi:hypothetical protein
MTIPTGEEIEALLNSIAMEIGAVRSQINETTERIQPLRDEQTVLKDQVKVIQEKHNEEIIYASEQERKIYEVYLEAQRHWNAYKESCRELKQRAEAGLAERQREIKTQIWDDEQAT